MSVLRMTLDTNCVIDAAQGDARAPDVERLVDLAVTGKVMLFLTGAFELDQERASVQNRETNWAWLSTQPVIGNEPVIARAPQPWRFDFSPLDDPGHGLVGDEAATVVTRLEEILLTPAWRHGEFDADDPALQREFRRRVADCQHLAGHVMSGNDYFVTSDIRDIVRKRELILSETGIRVLTPSEAVAIASPSP